MFFNCLKGDFVPVRSLRNFSPVIDFELKFVKMRYHYDNNKRKTLKSIKSEFCAI